MDLPRIVTMQTALLVGESRTGTCADPSCTSAAQSASWCGIFSTHTRRIIDGAICGGLLELTLCHTQLHGEFSVFYHETQ
jgi:hypothetical protein